MTHVHFQRLELTDDKCGLQYEYMGYAEYEFGTTLQARTAMAKALHEDKLRAEPAVLPIRGKPLDVLVFAHADHLDDALSIISSMTHNKGVLVTPTTVGWLSVDPRRGPRRDEDAVWVDGTKYMFLVLKADDQKILQHGTKFLRSAIADCLNLGLIPARETASA